MTKSMNMNQNNEVHAASIAATNVQKEMTSYKDRNLNVEFNLENAHVLSYVNPNNGMGTFLINRTTSLQTVAWNTNCARNKTCLNADAYEAGELYKQIIVGGELPGHPGSRGETMTKQEYDTILAANNNNYSALANSTRQSYWLATPSSSTEVYLVNGGSGQLTTAKADATAGVNRWIRYMPLPLATMSATKTSFTMREGNFSGNLNNTVFSTLTLDTSGKTINYIIKSGDPSGIFKINSALHQ